MDSQGHYACFKTTEQLTLENITILYALGASVVWLQTRMCADARCLVWLQSIQLCVNAAMVSCILQGDPELTDLLSRAPTLSRRMTATANGSKEVSKRDENKYGLRQGVKAGCEFGHEGTLWSQLSQNESQTNYSASQQGATS